MHDSATKVLDGIVELSPSHLSRQSDVEIVANLVTVRGIGRCPAAGFLIVQLRRLSVCPVGDYGLRRGYRLAWNVPTPSPRELEPLGEQYSGLPNGCGPGGR